MNMRMKNRLSMDEPLDNKSVYELPGVGELSGKILFTKGYRVAADIYKEYKNCNKDLSRFQHWMRCVCNSTKFNAERCYTYLRAHEEQFGDYVNITKAKKSNDPDEEDLDAKVDYIDIQLDKLSFGEGSSEITPENKKTPLQNEYDELVKFFFSKMNIVQKLPKSVQLQVKRQISQIVSNAEDLSKPCKIYNSNRDKGEEIAVKSLEDLLTKASKIWELSAENLTVVLNCDGTKVDDEEYFSSLDPGTAFMILHGEEKWSSLLPGVSLDQTDAITIETTEKNKELLKLVNYVLQDIHYICILNDEELDMLAEMKPESISKIVKGQDNFTHLKRIKEACERIIVEKREAQDAMELLQLYDTVKSANESSCSIRATACCVLEDETAPKCRNKIRPIFQ